MKHRSIIHYFIDGFFLANKSLEVLFIGLLLDIPSFVHLYLRNTFFDKTLASIGFVFLFITIGFLLSIPIILVTKQQNKSIQYKKFFIKVLINTKRIIIPCIILFFLFFILLILFLLLLGFFLHPTRSQILKFFHGLLLLSKDWRIFLLIPAILAFFEFTSFYFSLEQNNLFVSLRKSFITAVKNLNYIALVIVFGIIVYCLNSFIPLVTFWGLLLRSVIGLYFNLILIASSLLYYRNVVKKQR